ncbi:MAG: hypothetical protein RLZZ350_1146, partial [Verrucomicrobiota bacterium]
DEEARLVAARGGLLRDEFGREVKIKVGGQHTWSFGSGIAGFKFQVEGVEAASESEFVIMIVIHRTG